MIASRTIGASPAEAAPGISTVATSRFSRISAPAASFDIFQTVQEFAPGAYLRWHTHDGPVFSLVLSGRLTLRRDGTQSTYEAGEFGECGPGVHSPGNEVSNVEMRRLLTGLIPAGAPRSRPAEGPSNPELLGRELFPASVISVNDTLPEFDFVQSVVELEPGVVSVPYAAEGANLWTVIQGETRVELGNARNSYRVGQQFTLEAGQAATIANDSDVPGRLALSVLLPLRASLAPIVVNEEAAKAPSSAPQVRPPSTGDGGLYRD